jgi:hypothetical protein
MRGARIVALLIAGAVGLGFTAHPVAAGTTKPKAKTNAKAKAKAKKKRKVKAPTRCRPGLLLVKTGKTRRCVRLNVAPPPPRDVDRTQLALNHALASWPAMRDKRGRKVVPFAQRLKRVKGGTATLRRTWARGVATMSAGRPNARLAPPLRAFAASARGGPTARAAGGNVSGTSDGGSLGFRGEVPMGDLRLFISYATNDIDKSVQSERCPTGAGVMDGTRSIRHSLDLRITRDNRLVSSLSTTWIDVAKFKGQTADDAKFDTLDVDHEGLAIMTIRGAGHGPIGLIIRTKRTATANMRGGGYTLNTPPPEVQASVSGALASLAPELEAELARRMNGDAQQSFGEFVSQGMSSYRIKQDAFNQDNVCVTVHTDPSADPVKYTINQKGSFTSWVEADRDRGTRLNGIWKLVENYKAETTPGDANGTSPRWEFTVKSIEQPSIPGRAGIRVTSKAGVGFKQQAIPLRPDVAYFRVTNAVYRDQMTVDGAFPIGSCTQTSSQNNTLTFEASGQPYDGAVGPTVLPGLAPGSQEGSLTAKGTIGKSATFQGCQLNSSGTDWEQCTLSGTGTEPYVTLLQIVMPPGDGPATVTWLPRGPAVGDVPPPGITPCVPTSGTGPIPDAQTLSLPRSRFEDPGTHTIAMDVPFEGPGIGGTGTLRSNAHYEITFERVNEDGSRYTG